MWKSQDTAVDIVSFSLLTAIFVPKFWRGVIFHFPHWWSSKDWWQFIKHKLIMINADWSLIMYSLDNSLFFPRPGWPVSAIRTAQGGRKTSSGSWAEKLSWPSPSRAIPPSTCSTHVRCLHNTGDSVPKISAHQLVAASRLLYISCVSPIVCKATFRRKLSKKANCPQIGQIERKMLSLVPPKLVYGSMATECLQR